MAQAQAPSDSHKLLAASPAAPRNADLKNEFGEAGNSLCCPSFMSCCLSTMFPCAWICGGFQTIDEKTENVMLNYGKYFATIRQPGWYCVNPCGMESRRVLTVRTAVDLTHVKVADAKGNPLNVSGIITYHIVDSRKAVLDTKDAREYIMTQGLAVMKRIASMYPYEGEHSLKSEADTLRKQMVALLQERVDSAGLEVLSFELTDLSYAPEIAQAMLVRQQAEAMIEARQTIVKGAVSISLGAMKGLRERGIVMSPDEESRMVSNLLVVICDSKGR
jgi:regulator of protease activity HflC (stomatin/prohibitin superfamily)